MLIEITKRLARNKKHVVIERTIILVMTDSVVKVAVKLETIKLSAKV